MADDMGFGLGRRQEHDPESRNYEFGARKLVRRFSVTHTLHAPALDQGNSSACTGFSAAQLINCGKGIRSRRRGAHQSTYLTSDHAFAWYTLNTRLDEFDGVYPPDDVGSSGLGIGKAGVDQRYWDRYEWTFTFEGFLAALQRQPVLLGTVWYSDMFYPDSHNVVRAMGEESGGHEYLARGINFTEKLIHCRNSWGPRWGWNGDFWISFADMERLLIEDRGDVLVPVLL